MSSLISISIKGNDGQYKDYTLSVSDEANKFGQNVSMWVTQTEEERNSKKPRTFVGNGRVVWTDGTINKVDKNTGVDIANETIDKK